MSTHVLLLMSSLEVQNFGYFGVRVGFFPKKYFKVFRSTILGIFSSGMRVKFSYCLRSLKTIKIVGFMEKEMVFSQKYLLIFQKYLVIFENTQHGYFPSESVSKVILAYAISKGSNLENFGKQWCFFRKNP